MKVNEGTVAVARLDAALQAGARFSLIERLHDGLVDYLRTRNFPDRNNAPDPDWTPYPVARDFFTQVELSPFRGNHV